MTLEGAGWFVSSTRLAVVTFLTTIAITLVILQLRTSTIQASDQVGHAFGEEHLCGSGAQDNGASITPGQGAAGVSSLLTVWDIFTEQAKSPNNFGTTGDSVLEAYVGSKAQHTDWGNVPKFGTFVGFATGRMSKKPGRAVAFQWTQSNGKEQANKLEILAHFDIPASPGGSAKQFPIKIETVLWQFNAVESVTVCFGGGLKYDAFGRSLVDGRMINSENEIILSECNPFHGMGFPPSEPDHFGFCTAGAGGGTNRDPRKGWYFGDYDTNKIQSSVAGAGTWVDYSATSKRLSGDHHHIYKPTGQSGFPKWGACGHDEGRYGSGGPCIPTGAED
jgi:hypothetical protein